MRIPNFFFIIIFSGLATFGFEDHHNLIGNLGHEPFFKYPFGLVAGVMGVVGAISYALKSLSEMDWGEDEDEDDNY